ncbi:hypothetical protein DFH07DRAFT_781001 [Mycena maculata]|uniref:Uncharacterized protein n=1 Tax=Mycena maculata TaxID=230809 RepID=A0AAD7I052_9AGAR|nr:hypothetical protein DFH07DRAFT_781001 [Mycena maculata]
MEGDELDADCKRRTEVFEMWYRDPVECVQELSGNPTFTKQELHPIGATLAPIILASDKTQLTRFSGDKQPRPTAHRLNEQIPVSKLEIFSKKKHSQALHKMFHDCMLIMLGALKAAGSHGVTIDCADGFVRKIFPVLAAYIADYLKQCLVTCCMENLCPGCLCLPKGRSNADHAESQDPLFTLKTLGEQSRGNAPLALSEHNLHPINPFWVVASTPYGIDIPYFTNQSG